MCPNSRINSGNGSGANGFRLQPEELEVGTKLLIFVYLTLSEYTISRSSPHGVQHLTCWLPAG